MTPTTTESRPAPLATEHQLAMLNRLGKLTLREANPESRVTHQAADDALQRFLAEDAE